MYHIVFTLSTYRKYCHARGLADELANEFLYDNYYTEGEWKNRGKKNRRERGSLRLETDF